MVQPAARFVLGPWQPRWWFVFAVFTVVQLFRLDEDSLTLGLFTFSGKFDLQTASWVQIALSFPYGVARAAIAVGISWLTFLMIRVVTRSSVLTRASYPVFLLVLALIVTVSRVGSTGTDLTENPGVVVGFFIRSLVLLVVLFGSMGVLELNFAQQARRADENAAVVRAQRASVIQAEERAMQSIARVLHDRVQAGIVAVSLRLAQLKARTDQDVADEITASIAELEHIRSQDLRAAWQQLSPDLQHAGLGGALEDLGRRYAPAMDVLVRDTTQRADWVIPGVETERALLGAYRIVEQAVLNAAVHGRATHVTVIVERGIDDITITVTDDGVGLPDEVTPGTGQAVIESWTGILQGTWVRESAARGGAQVRVRLPIAP